VTELHTLYAISHSLYSGRARSYLIKSGIPFRELSTGHESFKADILPKAKLPTIPTLLTPTGEVIRDGAAIIEHFEAANGRPYRPPTPRQNIVSLLFDMIGTDGLLRPAMHYRWNYPEENLDYLHYHFFYSQRDLPERAAKTEKMMNRMRDAGQAFGVSEKSKALVETLYLEFLAALNEHLTHTPYLLGWQPCIGDFGLLAPMYAHLGRDPKPLRIMQQQAVRVQRWVERMNWPGQDIPEFFEGGEGYLADDEIPASLIAVLKILAEDLVPETRAAAEFINSWLADNQPEAGTPAERMLGMAQFIVRGAEMTAVAQSYRFYMLQQVQAAYAELDSVAQEEVDAMLRSCDLAELLTISLDRQIGRADNLEIWL
jgi:glutathione S-transferase